MSVIVEGRDARPDDIERDLQESTCENECVDRKDWIKRDGLGDSPGIPGIEYLGLGYNMLEGNPRGTAKSELDPGYRHRVVDIVQDQSRTTLDTDYMMPYGGKLRMWPLNTTAQILVIFSNLWLSTLLLQSRLSPLPRASLPQRLRKFRMINSTSTRSRRRCHRKPASTGAFQMLSFRSVQNYLSPRVKSSKATPRALKKQRL